MCSTKGLKTPNPSTRPMEREAHEGGHEPSMLQFLKIKHEEVVTKFKEQGGIKAAFKNECDPKLGWVVFSQFKACDCSSGRGI